MPGLGTGQLLNLGPHAAGRPRRLLAHEAPELRPEEMHDGGHPLLLWPQGLGPQSVKYTKRPFRL